MRSVIWNKHQHKKIEQLDKLVMMPKWALKYKDRKEELVVKVAVCQDRRDLKALEERQVDPEGQESQAFQATQVDHRSSHASQSLHRHANLAHKDHLAHLDHQDCQVTPDQMVFQGMEAEMAYPDLQDQKDHQDHQACQERQGRKGLPEEMPLAQYSQENLDHQVNWDLLMDTYSLNPEQI